MVTFLQEFNARLSLMYLISKISFLNEYSIEVTVRSSDTRAIIIRNFNWIANF